MKMTFESRSVAIVGVEAPVEEFKIELGPEMFDLLSGIYSDTILACAREVMTNALDGHARLRTLDPTAPVRPIEIHLPNRMEPWFSVKDFGSSMTHEEVTRIFRSYGASTKRESNDEVGGFGIGSKAPFAYEGADQWTLECRLDGEKRIYSMFRNDVGIPAMLLLDTVPTDEPRGVTVTIPVQFQDFQTFRSKVAFLLPYYPAEVTLTGERLEKPRLDYLLSGTGWGVKRGSGYNYVIMGNVPYRVDQRWLSEHGKLPADLFHGYSVDLYVPVGAVTMAPNREQLKDTKHTFQGVAAACQTMLAEFKAKVTAQIAGAKTRWAALQIIHEAYGISALRRELTGLVWHGTQLDLSVGINFELEELRKNFPDLTLRTCENVGRSRTFSILPAFRGRIVPGMQHTFVFFDDMEDDPRRAERRLRHFMSEECGVLKFRRRSYANDYGVAFVFQSAALSPDRLGVELDGFPDVRLLSRLPDPPKKPRQTRTKTRVKQLTGISWNEVEVEAEEGGYYVRLEGRNDMMNFAGDLRALFQLLQTAKEHGLVPKDAALYGIPRTRKSLETKRGWVEFTSLVRRKATRVVEDGAYELAEFATWTNALDEPVVKFLLQADLSRLPARAFAHKMKAAAEVMQGKKVRLTALRSLACYLGIEIPPSTRKIRNDGAALLRTFYDHYPMIRVLVEGIGGHYASSRLTLETEAVLTYMAQPKAQTKSGHEVATK